MNQAIFFNNKTQWASFFLKEGDKILEISLKSGGDVEAVWIRGINLWRSSRLEVRDKTSREWLHCRVRIAAL